MADPKATTTEEQESADDGPSPFQIALGFFILPLLLVIAGVGVFLLFGVLAHDSAPPEEYLSQINGRGINEPWQAAFHLSQQLQFDDSLQGDPEFAARVVRTMERAEDPRVNRFLAIALGRIGHQDAVPALVAQLQAEDAEVRLNSLWALGKIGHDEAAAPVAERLQDRDEAVRTMAGYVLGVLGDPSTREPLEVALNDPVTAVRFNAAVALGLMGDPAALPVLARMIDRDHLAALPEFGPDDRSTTIVAALRALEVLGAGGLEERLRELRDDDPDLQVREAARQVLAAANRSAESATALLTPEPVIHHHE